MLVNAIAHQYLIPAVQIGSRIDVDPATGAVGDICTNIRWILPGLTGCLRCGDLICRPVSKTKRLAKSGSVTATSTRSRPPA